MNRNYFKRYLNVSQSKKVVVDYLISFWGYSLTIIRDLIITYILTANHASIFYNFLSICNTSSSFLSNYIIIGNRIGSKVLLSILIIFSSIIPALVLFDSGNNLYVKAFFVTILSIISSVLLRNIFFSYGVLVYRLCTSLPPLLTIIFTLFFSEAINSFLFSLIVFNLYGLYRNLFSLSSFINIQESFSDFLKHLYDIFIASSGIIYLNIAQFWFYSFQHSKIEIMLSRIILIFVSLLSIPVLHLDKINIKVSYQHYFKLILLLFYALIIIFIFINLRSDIYLFFFLSIVSILFNYSSRIYFLNNRY